ncbi:MAG TPA: DUF2795 domain-containing protein [Gemmataceae bacterium]|nr:DUF2795 domain-containing protein [Gemmataceae bacterium]
MERLAGGKTRESVLEYIRGVSFPAHKDDLVHAARKNGAPNDIISALEQLPANELADEEQLIDVYPRLD